VGRGRPRASLSFSIATAESGVHHGQARHHASCAVLVDLPGERFDLADWIVHFSNEDYVACTPASGAHKLMLVYRDADGGYVFRNDEFCGGFQMTQLYRAEIIEKDHVFLVSPATKGRFLWTVPMTFRITWDMTVERVDDATSKFTCRVGARLNPVYWLLSKLIRLDYWTQAHTEEETPHFADCAARWATRNDKDRAESYVSPGGRP
jgi:hypothetical protein